jgi:hypothetical protein
MAGNPDEAADLLVPQLVERLENSVLGFDLREVILATEAGHMDQVDLIGL